jgi:PhoD-like phosphatase, N-terminal domain
VDIPQLAVPFPHHRKLYEDDEARCDKTISFKYGVASGDPFPNSVVIWTRATPVADSRSATQGNIQVRYRVCSDAAMKNEVAKGKVLTSADVDFSVKVIVEGLQPSTKYYYDFSACDKKISSAVGKTKTAPAADADVQSVSLATVSCSKFDVGYFHAYGGIADKADSLDAVLHLGTHVLTVHVHFGIALSRQARCGKLTLLACMCTVQTKLFLLLTLWRAYMMNFLYWHVILSYFLLYYYDHVHNGR